MKPTITKEQAEAIESARGFGHEDDWMLLSHAEFISGYSDRWYDGHTFDDMDVTTLAAALINGYEVKKMPEEKVREYHRSLVCDMDRSLSYEEEGNYRSAIEAVEETLNLLGIKIEGVNVN